MFDMQKCCTNRQMQTEMNGWNPQCGSSAHMHTRTHTHTNTHTHTHTHTYTRTNTQTQKHTHIYIHTHTHTHTLSLSLSLSLSLLCFALGSRLRVAPQPARSRTPSTILLEGLGCTKELRADRFRRFWCPRGGRSEQKTAQQLNLPCEGLLPYRVPRELTPAQPYLPDPACIPNRSLTPADDLDLPLNPETSTWSATATDLT